MTTQTLNPWIDIDGCFMCDGMGSMYLGLYPSNSRTPSCSTLKGSNNRIDLYTAVLCFVFPPWRNYDNKRTYVSLINDCCMLDLAAHRLHIHVDASCGLHAIWMKSGVEQLAFIAVQYNSWSGKRVNAHFPLCWVPTCLRLRSMEWRHCDSLPVVSGGRYYCTIAVQYQSAENLKIFMAI